jgi:hypothetical protein
MKFKITGKGDTEVVEIKNFLDIFARQCEKSYREQIGGSKVMRAVSHISKISPVPVLPFNAPTEIMIATYIENNSVIFEMPAMLPAKFIQKRADKRMKENLEGFLKSQGLNVNVEVLR